MKSSRADSMIVQAKGDHVKKLNHLYEIAEATIMSKQDPITGLIPSGSDNEAWVRDNVYGSLAMWGLSLAYRKLLDFMENKSRCYELEQAVIKLMRGLLQCMMNQRHKVEAFKSSMCPADALHAKYSSKTTDPVVGDFEYGHLQLDATSLYMLMMAQMTSSGFTIIFTLDEVAFVQNLVFYIQNAYMTPDYGVWERGDKTNHGVPELNTTSVGMAKAALESLDELNLFGANGGPYSIIHVSPDFIVWCNNVIEAVLPRESTSKETDAALLSIVSFPAFAVNTLHLVEITKEVILKKLQGKYGMKRFLRDGYKCPREDASRLYYDPSELKLFDNLECEWPIFWTYLIIDAIFRENAEQKEEISVMLESVLLEDKNRYPLIPQLYAVPADRIEKELESPGSQDRISAGQVPFTWGQSLYLLSLLLHEGFIAPGELDPLNRRLRIDPHPDTIVQVSILTESLELYERFAALGIPVFQVSDCAPITVYPLELLIEIMSLLGRSDRLGLKGNTVNEIGCMSASMLYTLEERIFAFIPEMFTQQNFYANADSDFQLDSFISYVSIVEKNWTNKSGRPTVIFYVSEAQLDASGNIPQSYVTACKNITNGYFGGIRMNYGPLQDFLDTSCMSSLDFLSNYCDISRSISKFCIGSGGSRYPSQTARRLPENLVCSHRKSADVVCVESQQAKLYKGKRAKKLTEIRSAVRQSRLKMQVSVDTSKVQQNLDEAANLDNVISLREADEGGIGGRKLMSGAASLKTRNVDDVISLLSHDADLNDQVDLLYFLYITKGLGFRFMLNGQECVLVDLILELYNKALRLRLWWIIRLCAGMLNMWSKSLSNALSSILIHNKQVSIGCFTRSGLREVVFAKPVTLERLHAEISDICGNDINMIVLLQETIICLAAVISTDASIFKEMIQIRVGLIVHILIEELQRLYRCTYDQAYTRLLSLSPFEYKTLIKYLLTGHEINESRRTVISRRVKGTTNGKLPLKPGKWLGDHRKSIAALDLGDSKDDGSPDSDKSGQWLRRRRIDGSLNRVPVGFYERIWQALQKCNGYVIANIVLASNLTREMTRGEMKFAMEIEKAINSIPVPHYRQIIVEATQMCSLILLSNSRFQYNDVIDMDVIVGNAASLFKRDLLNSGTRTEAFLKCVPSPEYPRSGCIVPQFFDSAPSGRYGTMNYILRVLFQLFHKNNEFEWTLDSSTTTAETEL